MISPIPHSSAPFKVLAWVMRAALWLLALAWLVMGLAWGVLHFAIVPRIAELRPWLEQQASQAVGAPVRIGSITTLSNGLIPSITLADVRLLDAQGREALRLPSVQVAVSPRSLLGLGLEQLYVESPVLEVRRTADGRIWVAGFAIPTTQTADSPAADWVFSQTELALRHGTVHWTDELRGAPTVTLNEVDWVLRKRHFTHTMRVDATPPAQLGSRFTLTAIGVQPLLSAGSGRWREWDVQLFADFAQVEVAQLRRYVDLGVDVSRGVGALRVWAHVDQAALKEVTADVALQDVNVTVERRLQALALRTVAGRLGYRHVYGGREFFTETLQFDTQDGMRWPGGNVRLGLYPATMTKEAKGELVADKLDLAALAAIATRLPLGDDVHTQMAALAPRGLVEQVQASWTGPIAQPERYGVKGRVKGLELAAQAQDGNNRPGVQGLDVDFDLNQAGGKAHLSMQGGSIDLPGIFEDPRIRLDQLSTDVQWKHDGEHFSLSLPKVLFANADAQGEAQVQWKTADTGPRFPGVLDLQGSLSRADGARVHRYLPLVMPADVRNYVRDAVHAGTGSNVKFKVKGNLHELPYTDARQGDFRISADFQNAEYAYAPPSLLAPGSAPWPALTQLSGELVMDRGLLQIKRVRGSLGGAKSLSISKAEATITQLYDSAVVSVDAQARGPLAEALGVVNSSPLAALTDHVLAHASATGSADYKLKLSFPVADVNKIAVQGSVLLAGNDLQVTPETPRLARTKGTVNFTETGFSVSGMQARTLGGDMRMEGGLNVLAAQAPLQPGHPPLPVLRMQGTASAEGLRQAKELGFVARLGTYAQGSAAYTATLGLRGNVPEMSINSHLTGMAVSLPAPFAKNAETPMALRLETRAIPTVGAVGGSGVQRSQDVLKVELANLASVSYVRDLAGTDARALRGAIAIGLAADESAPMPAQGVVANVRMGVVDVDAWEQVLTKVTGSTPLTGAGSGPSASFANAATIAAMSYLPTAMAVRAQDVSVGGRHINRVVVGGVRDGLLWRANVDSNELSGYVEYRQSTGPTAGRVYARLARLIIGQREAQDVENLLDEQPTTIPALDVVIEDFDLRGKKLGRLEIDAVNLGAGAPRDVAREWRMNRFNITTPEATLTASGNWTNVNAMVAPGAPRSIKDRRRTVMTFKLDVRDAGELLARFNMNGVVRKGAGKVEGQVAWLGSPITLDYPSLSGNVNVNIENGQFLKADPGIAKLLGVLSLQSLPRRLLLDFRDVFNEGFAFDFFRGDMVVDKGVAHTTNLQMKGVNAAVFMEGQTDIAKETQNLRVLVVPEINAGSASVLAGILNPIVGLSTFLAQVVLRRPLIDANTQELVLDGTWTDPRVTTVDRRPAASAAPATPTK